MKNEPSIDGGRLLDRIRALGRIGALPGGGVCRLALSLEDKAARDCLVGWMKELGLDVAVDRIGNIFGVRAGRTKGTPIMVGSHIDTVRTGGLYDGSLGVLAGLEIVVALDAAGVVTDRPIAIAAFTNEEGARFAPDMMGSLVFVGGLSPDDALATVGIDGARVGDCLNRIGYAGDASPFPDGVHAYVELHIEQGPVLEAEGKDIGIVEGVQAISWTELMIHGISAHAGTTPMRLRRDAGHAASAIAVGVRRIVEEFGGDQLGAVGSLTLEPNLVNVVAERARMTIDLRNPSEATLCDAEARLDSLAGLVAQEENVTVESRRLARFQATDFNIPLLSRFETEARRRGLSTRRLFSGAGHDAQILARICPSAMIFVPSVGGISHNINEHTCPGDIANGANLLLAVVIDLAGITRDNNRGAAPQ